MIQVIRNLFCESFCLTILKPSPPVITISIIFLVFLRVSALCFLLTDLLISANSNSLGVLGRVKYLRFFISCLVSAVNMLLLCGFALPYSLVYYVSGVRIYVFMCSILSLSSVLKLFRKSTWNLLPRSF